MFMDALQAKYRDAPQAPGDERRGRSECQHDVGRALSAFPAAQLRSRHGDREGLSADRRAGRAAAVPASAVAGASSVERDGSVSAGSSTRSSATRSVVRGSRRAGRVGAGVSPAPDAPLLASRRGQRGDGADRRRHGHVFGGERRIGVRSLTTWSRFGADPSRERNRRRSPRPAASRPFEHRDDRQSAIADVRRRVHHDVCRSECADQVLDGCRIAKRRTERLDRRRVKERKATAVAVDDLLPCRVA